MFVPIDRLLILEKAPKLRIVWLSIDSSLKSTYESWMKGLISFFLNLKWNDAEASSGVYSKESNFKLWVCKDDVIPNLRLLKLYGH